MAIALVILAAGKGTRMNSDLPKVLHRLGAAPLVAHAMLSGQALEPEAVIELLTQIKGVGRWTVEMLLMFSLGHEDVFALDDLGIQQAMIRLYKIKYTTKKELQAKMLKRSLSWSPYRTYACLHLWNWKDSGAV